METCVKHLRLQKTWIRCCCSFIFCLQEKRRSCWSEGSNGERGGPMCVLSWRTSSTRERTAAMGSYTGWIPAPDRTQGVCLAEDTGCLPRRGLREVDGGQKRDTGSGDHHAASEDGQASPERWLMETAKGGALGLGLNRLIWVDSGFGLSLSHRKKSHFHPQCPEVAQFLNLWRVHLEDAIIIIQDKVK